MKKLIFTLIALSFLISCNNDDDIPEVVEIPEGPGEVTLESEVNEFIWRGLNYWYFWQEDQGDLADNRFANTDELFAYLNGFDSSKDLFDSLIFEPGVTDDFSWYIEDVEAQLNSFRGISESHGVRFPRPAVFQINEQTGAVVIPIAYVIPNSPADRAGLKRGDLIYKVNGVELDIDNFGIINTALANIDLSFELANIQGNEVVPISGEFSFSAELLTENPVHYFDIIEEANKKIGYLVYNGFRNTFNGELNEVFGLFKNEAIDELVLDLRYNGGGSVLTSAYLASMIDGAVSANSETFARLRYNTKRDAEEGFTYQFYDDVILFNKTTSERAGQESTNRLTTLNRLFVIGSQRTASASEMIINGLRPYMEVILVGETTVGKNEGSITVVDSGSPFTNLNNRNSNHTVGMQPIVFQIFNSLGESDYTFGFEPDFNVREADDLADIKPFGDPDEILLRTTLDIISGASSKSVANKMIQNNYRPIENGVEQPRFTNEMYLMDAEIELLKKE